jgi:plastocyanin
MNHYQISGIIILILVAALGVVTLWPVNHVPSVAVEFPTENGEATTTPGAVVPQAPAKPKATTPATPVASTAGAGVRTFEKGYYVTTVHYTDTGFVPAQLEIKAGEEVRFVNKTNSALHISADPSTSSQYYRAFNQPNTVFKGGTYQFQVPQVGTMNYTNINKSSATGQIIVK